MNPPLFGEHKIMHRTPRNTGFGLLLKAIEQIDQDMQQAEADITESAARLGVEPPKPEHFESPDAIIRALESQNVELAAIRVRQILQEAGRDFVEGRMPAMAFLEIERRIKAASEAINRRAARLEPFGGS